MAKIDKLVMSLKRRKELGDSDDLQRWVRDLQRLLNMIYVLQDVCPGCPENEIGPHTFVSAELDVNNPGLKAGALQMA